MFVIFTSTSDSGFHHSIPRVSFVIITLELRDRKFPRTYTRRLAKGLKRKALLLLNEGEEIMAKDNGSRLRSLHWEEFQ